MEENEKRDIPIGPEVMKFGVVLAISVGGVIFYTVFRRKRIKPSKPKSSYSFPVIGSQAASRGKISENDIGLQIFSSSKSSESRDDFLTPISITIDDIFPKKNEQSLLPNIQSPNNEIEMLKNNVKILEEREKTMKNQLLKYQGLIDQQTLKIESLQSDKRLFEAQMADYEVVVIELEDLKANINFLENKLKSDEEQYRDQILSLQERIMKWRDEEIKKIQTVEIDENAKMKELDEMKKIKTVEIDENEKMKELEEIKKIKTVEIDDDAKMKELDEMKEMNNGLKLENSELARKLEYLSTLENEEIQELKQESQRLRQQNEDLKTKIEQLQVDRCSEPEELVYLRWINACLRYELRNYHPAPGKTIARDLNKSLSNRSGEKAKQLILEYAKNEGLRGKTVNISDIDSYQLSISQTSYITDSGEPDESALNRFSTNETFIQAKVNFSPS